MGYPRPPHGSSGLELWLPQGTFATLDRRSYLNIHMHLHVHTLFIHAYVYNICIDANIYVHIYIYVYMCICVCVRPPLWFITDGLSLRQSMALTSVWKGPKTIG